LGLDSAYREQLSQLTKVAVAHAVEHHSTRTAVHPSSVKPGTRLVREWRGRTHAVVVTEDGFEYAVKAFPSLTKIAHAITGAHWSGPRFFGLLRKHAANGQLGSDATGSLDAEEVANG
jgi:hypothetical protein